MNLSVFHALVPALVAAAGFLGFHCGKLSGETKIRTRAGGAIQNELDRIDDTLARQFDQPSVKAIARFYIITTLRRVADAVRDEKIPK